MSIELLTLIALLGVSLGLNVFLLYRIKSKSLKQNTRDAQSLLEDLLKGEAIVRIERVDPAHVFLSRWD